MSKFKLLSKMPALLLALLLFASTHVDAMKCVLQSKHTSQPGWWNLVATSPPAVVNAVYANTRIRNCWAMPLTAVDNSTRALTTLSLFPSQYPLMRTLDANPYQMIDQRNGYTYYFNVCDNTVPTSMQTPHVSHR